MLSSIDQFNVMSYTINSTLPGTHPKLQHCPQYKTNTIYKSFQLNVPLLI